MTTLVEGYDAVLLDLDGVVYLGEQPVPGAAEAIARLRAAGVPVGYVTNNASRAAAEVAALLNRLGVAADVDEVVTSAQAAARLLAERFPPGTPVLVVGSAALRAEVAAVDLVPVLEAGLAEAVVQGYALTVGWTDLAEASVAIRGGALWVATNTDATLPSPRGPLPGNGSLVAALATALGRGPDVVVGKPEPTLLLAAAAARGARRPLFVGDRLDTDIAGAHRVGFDSLLVLTGVHGRADVESAPADQRPTYVGEDLGALFSRTR